MLATVEQYGADMAALGIQYGLKEVAGREVHRLGQDADQVDHGQGPLVSSAPQAPRGGRRQRAERGRLRPASATAVGGGAGPRRLETGSGMDNPILTMSAVGKRFPGVVALRGVSLEIARGEGHVLLGENGAGKSTLINLLAGVYQADEGEIVFDGAPYRPRTPTDAYRAGIRVVHQELSMLSQMTVAENLLFESLPQRRGLVNYRETNRRAAALLEEVGLDVAPTTLVSRLGVAQMQLVEIAKTLAFESKLLILDEPTATLTSKEVDRLFEIIRRLKAREVTILYISHRLQEIYEVGDRVTVLRDGQLVATRPLAGLTIPEIVHMMVGRSLEGEHAFREDVAVTGEALRVEGLRRNAKTPAVSFRVGKGEIVGVAGLVGSGRTETARAIFGADPKVAGRDLRRGRARRHRVAQGRRAARALSDDRGPQGAGPAARHVLRREHHHHRFEEDIEPRHSRARRRAGRGERSSSTTFASRRRRSTRRCATSPAATSRRW